MPCEFNKLYRPDRLPATNQFQSLNCPIQMEQLELKYKDEVKKNSSLLKMNDTLMRQVDTLNGFALEIFGMFCAQEIPEQHEFDKDQLQRLASVIRKKQSMPVTCPNCVNRKPTAKSAEEECERWKNLYVKQTEESYRLSQLNKELMQELQAIEEVRSDSQQAAAKLLEDYLKIYRQYHGGLADLRFMEAEKQGNDDQPTRDIKDPKGNSCKKRSSSSSKKPKKTKAIPEEVRRQEDALRQTLNELIQVNSRQSQTVHSELTKVLELFKQSEETSLLARRALMEHIMNN